MKSKGIFNQVLTTAAGEFVVNESEYAGPALFPVFEAAVQSGSFPVWERENLLNIPILKARSPGAPYPRMSLELGEDSFNTKDYGILLPLDDRQRAIYANQFSADRGKVQIGTRTLMLNKERRTHAIATGAGVPTSSPATKWDQANSDPIGDMRAVLEVIHDNCGINPNIAVIPRDVYNILTLHPKILELYKYTRGGDVTKEILAAIIGVSRVVVAGTVHNSAAEGQAMSISKVWGDSVVLAHVDAAMNIDSPSFGRTFAWKGYTGQSNGEIAVATYRDDDASSTIHKLMQDVQEKIASAACGYHLSNTLAA